MSSFCQENSLFLKTHLPQGKNKRDTDKNKHVKFIKCHIQDIFLFSYVGFFIDCCDTAQINGCPASSRFFFFPVTDPANNVPHIVTPNVPVLFNCSNTVSKN